MGRQISIAMSPDDERAFWDFLHSIANVVIYRSWSPAEEPVGSFVIDRGAHTFYIHNKAFPWQPKFERVDYTNQEAGESGTYFRIIDHHAPFVHYSRHPLHAPNPDAGGRLYWSKYSTPQPNELNYDVELFDKWFSLLMRWMRKRGVKTAHGNCTVWALPGARAQIEAGQLSI